MSNYKITLEEWELENLLFVIKFFLNKKPDDWEMGNLYKRLAKLLWE